MKWYGDIWMESHFNLIEEVVCFCLASSKCCYMYSYVIYIYIIIGVKKKGNEVKYKGLCEGCIKLIDYFFFVLLFSHAKKKEVV